MVTLILPRDFEGAPRHLGSESDALRASALCQESASERVEGRNLPKQNKQNDSFDTPEGQTKNKNTKHQTSKVKHEHSRRHTTSSCISRVFNPSGLRKRSKAKQKSFLPERPSRRFQNPGCPPSQEEGSDGEGKPRSSVTKAGAEVMARYPTGRA